MTGIGNEEASPVCFPNSSLLSLSLLLRRFMQRIVLIIMNNVFFLLLLKFDVIQGFKYGEIDFFLSQTWIITQILH